MDDKKKYLFKGFSADTFEFLKDLAENNNKTWFEANKGIYRKHVFESLQDLVSDLAESMRAIDPHLVTVPAVDKTISRIHRDTRFSRDKSPYKSTVWITFKRAGKDWKDAPAFFMEISPDSYRYGMGFYNASRVTMDRLRGAMDKKPNEFLKAVAFMAKQDIFVAEGERYKKILKNDLPPKLLDWYQRKNIYLVCDRSMDGRLFSRKLTEDLIFGFNLIAPFYHYLWKVKKNE